MSEDPRNTPTTVRELGIQFQGFKELVDTKFTTLTDNIQRLAQALEDSNSNKASQHDLELLIARVLILEKARAKNWLFNTASAGVGALLFFLVQYALTH